MLIKAEKVYARDLKKKKKKENKQKQMLSLFIIHMKFILQNGILIQLYVSVQCV